MDTTLGAARRPAPRLKRTSLIVATLLLLGSVASTVNYYRACPDGRDIVIRGAIRSPDNPACADGVIGYTTDRLAWFFSNL